MKMLKRGTVEHVKCRRFYSSPFLGNHKLPSNENDIFLMNKFSWMTMLTLSSYKSSLPFLFEPRSEIFSSYIFTRFLNTDFQTFAGSQTRFWEHQGQKFLDALKNDTKVNF